jgi:hypothetical protein
MTYFKDLSQYTFLPRKAAPMAKNVGWLERGRAFDQQEPTEEVLEALWSHVTILVMQTRGRHLCDLCRPAKSIVAQRNKRRVLLGTSEMRIFGDGEIYAAPSLIFHYVHTHHYKPPAEFVAALLNGPRPPNQEYFEKLGSTGVDWRDAPAPSSEVLALRSEKIGGETRRAGVAIPTYLDES